MKERLKVNDSYPENMLFAAGIYCDEGSYDESMEDIVYTILLYNPDMTSVLEYLLAHYKYGLSYKKIAKIFGISKKSVKQGIEKGLHDLVAEEEMISIGVKKYAVEQSELHAMKELDEKRSEYEREITTLKADYENKIKRLKETIKTTSKKSQSIDTDLGKIDDVDISSRDRTVLSKAGISTYTDMVDKGSEYLCSIKYINKNTIIKLLCKIIAKLITEKEKGGK